MSFIPAIKDYYGLPSGQMIYINPNYIIKMEFMCELEDSSGKKYEDHYLITIDFGNRVETAHILLSIGNKLLEDGGIKI